MPTVFVELSGAGAKSELEALLNELRDNATCQRVELLESLEQMGLYLLVCECREHPDLTWPEGARVWSFRRLPG